MLETQIARARSLKLHFYGDKTYNSGHQIAIFQCLAQRSSVWEELSIGLTSDLCPVPATIRDRIPSLRSLWIEWKDWESSTAVEALAAFHSAPSLFDVSIYNEYRFIPVSLPAHQLARYDVDAPMVHEEVLKMASNLVEARLSIAFDNEPSPEHCEIIDLPHLQRLYVSDTGLLRCLRAPALRETGFRMDEDDLDLLRVFHPPGSLDACHVNEILQKYPSITELAILVNDIASEKFALDPLQPHRECGGVPAIIGNRFRT
ncbi:hypothetical protein FB451DRAFT_1439441 [Mycena latifolia]|nr:hypothetical protein FB451DRAFT_1439441 [Mycena latifolia]